MDRDIDMKYAEDYRKRAARVIRDICRSYGLYGNIVYHTPSPIADSDRNQLYIIAGHDPVIEKDLKDSGLQPDKIVRNIARNEKLFYPKVWAYNLFEDSNDIHAQQELVEYCKTADFLTQLYGEYDAELPERLRVSEINQLIEYRSAMDNPLSSPAFKASCKEALDWFFKREKSKSRFRRKWLSYYRSEYFPDDKGALARIIGYFKRNSNKVAFKRLMEINSDIHKLEMQEHEYKIFVKLMQEQHPDVVFSVGSKSVVDHGLINRSGETGPFGRAVTGEEYAVIRKQLFAKEGFAAIADLRPSYFEFRDVYYKAVDEPLVAGTYNRIVLSYAQPNSLMELKEYGAVSLARIPADDFMNFVSLAKANGLRFYIDHDADYANPSLDVINVLYNGCQEGKWQGIKKRMMNDKVEHSHLLGPQHLSLTNTLNSIENPKRDHKKGKSPESYLR